MRQIFSDNKKIFLFFFTLSLLFYGNSIKNDFCFDDSYVTVTNHPVNGQKFTPNNLLVAQGLKGIPKIWRSHYGHGEGTSYDYRPAVTTLFAIEYAVFGQAPHINHFISIVLYALIVFFLFQLLKRCLHQYPFKETFALVCSVLFLAHPIHSEVVNNIKCTDELLALLFGLLVSLNIIKFYDAKRLKYLAFAAVFMLLALYSKLTSAIFIALVPLIYFFFLKINKKQTLYLLLGLLTCLFLYRRSKALLVTEKEVRFFFHFENPLFSEHVSFFTKILFALKSLGVYIKLLLFPYPLRFYYGTDMVPTNVGVFDGEVILSVLFFLAGAYFCYRTKNKIAFFGLLFFGISIGPLINLIQPVAGIIGERLCFTSSVGFAIFVTSVLFSFYKTAPVQITLQLFTKKPMGYLSFILVVFLFYTWNRNLVWKDPLTLFEHDVPFLEKSAGANNLLANKYFDMFSSPNPKYSQQVLVEKCLKHYNLAIKYDSSVYSAFNNAGVVIFSYLQQTDVALNYFIRAVGVNPVYPQAYENIANCYDKLGKPEVAIKFYRIAISQNVLQRKSYIQMVKILLRQKRYQEVFNLMEITDKLFLNDYELTIQKGNYYFMNKQYELAAPKFEQAYASRGTKDLAYALFNTYSNLQNTEKAAYFKKQFESFHQ